jgi:hypothetical protein
MMKYANAYFIFPSFFGCYTSHPLLSILLDIFFSSQNNTQHLFFLVPCAFFTRSFAVASLLSPLRIFTNIIKSNKLCIVETFWIETSFAMNFNWILLEIMAMKSEIKKWRGNPREGEKRHREECEMCFTSCDPTLIIISGAQSSSLVFSFL